MNKYVWTRIYAVVALIFTVAAAAYLTLFFSPSFTAARDVAQFTASPRHPGIRLFDGRSIEQTFSLPAAANAVAIRVNAAGNKQLPARFIVQILTEPEGVVVASAAGNAADLIAGYDQWVGIVPALLPARLYRVRLSTEGVDAAAPLEFPADYEEDSAYPEGRVVVRDAAGTQIVNRSGNIALRFAYRFYRREKLLFQ